MAATALGSIISASWLGKVADRIGHLRIITLALTAAGLLLMPQAFVTSGWQLIALRFLMGLALGGLLPCIAAVIRHRVPEVDLDYRLIVVSDCCADPDHETNMFLLEKILPQYAFVTSSSEIAKAWA